MKTKFWVRDKDRMCSATYGDDHSNVADGFREVSAAEQDMFRAETLRLKKLPRNALRINATAHQIGQVIEESNR